MGEITANVAPGHTSTEVLAAYTAAMAKTPLPDGVHLKVGGENEQTTNRFVEMFYALLGGVGLMFVILVLAFNSLRYSAYLLSAVPLSLIGVFGGLTLTGQPLSFPSLLGIIALAGVIINHAIILMDSIIRRMKDGADKDLGDIVVDSAISRLRADCPHDDHDRGRHDTAHPRIEPLGPARLFDPLRPFLRDAAYPAPYPHARLSLAG